MSIIMVRYRDRDVYRDVPSVLQVMTYNNLVLVEVRAVTVSLSLEVQHATALMQMAACRNNRAFLPPPHFSFTTSFPPTTSL